jgi:hypothetical protein
MSRREKSRRGCCKESKREESGKRKKSEGERAEVRGSRAEERRAFDRIAERKRSEIREQRSKLRRESGVETRTAEATRLGRSEQKEREVRQRHSKESGREENGKKKSGGKTSPKITPKPELEPKPTHPFNVPETFTSKSKY